MLFIVLALGFNSLAISTVSSDNGKVAYYNPKKSAIEIINLDTSIAFRNTTILVGEIKTEPTDLAFSTDNQSLTVIMYSRREYIVYSLKTNKYKVTPFPKMTEANYKYIGFTKSLDDIILHSSDPIESRILKINFTSGLVTSELIFSKQQYIDTKVLIVGDTNYVTGLSEKGDLYVYDLDSKKLLHTCKMPKSVTEVMGRDTSYNIYIVKKYFPDQLYFVQSYPKNRTFIFDIQSLGVAKLKKEDDWCWTPTPEYRNKRYTNKNKEDCWEYKVRHNGNIETVIVRRCWNTSSSIKGSNKNNGIVSTYYFDSKNSFVKSFFDANWIVVDLDRKKIVYSEEGSSGIYKVYDLATHKDEFFKPEKKEEPKTQSQYPKYVNIKCPGCDGKGTTGCAEESTCSSCDGTGKPNTAFCSSCGGSGKESAIIRKEYKDISGNSHGTQNERVSTNTTCGMCNGTGYAPCKFCDGTGKKCISKKTCETCYGAKVIRK